MHERLVCYGSGLPTPLRNQPQHREDQCQGDRGARVDEINREERWLLIHDVKDEHHRNVSCGLTDRA